MSESYYDILGVGKKATDKEIKKAYRKLARKFHPDVSPDDEEAEEKFKRISEAYAVLGNPEKRKEYDRLGHEAFRAGFDPSQAYSWEGEWRSAQERLFEDFYFDLSDILGGTFGRYDRRSRRGADAEAFLEIGFMEAVKGTTARFSIDRGTLCSHCSGRGSALDGSTCPACGGGGAAQKVESVDVRIPPSVEDSSRLRVPGKGGPGRNGGPPGDLYIKVKVRSHPFFKRKGYDIHSEVPLSITEAALGAKISVETIDGTSSMRIPPGTQGGQVFRLKGKGASRRDGHGRGSHYVKVRIKIPRGLGPRGEELFRELDNLTRMEKGIKTG